MSDRQTTPARLPVMWVSMAVSAVALIGFMALYYFAPFAETSEYWDTLSIYLFYPPFALFAAITGTLLVRKFGAEEPPRRIWLWFTLGWWTWVVGEVFDLGVTIAGERVNDLAAPFYDIFAGSLNIMDLCWSVGYLFFGLALYFQFRNIRASGSDSKGWAYFLIVGTALVVGAGLTQLAIHAGMGEEVFAETGPEFGWWAMYLAVLYPTFDIAIGAAALWLAFLFGGRRWGRPWWGLISFAIADAISTFIWIGGIDSLSEASQYLVWLVSDSFYVAGYLIAGLGFLSILSLFSPIKGGQE